MGCGGARRTAPKGCAELGARRLLILAENWRHLSNEAKVLAGVKSPTRSRRPSNRAGNVYGVMGRKEEIMERIVTL